MNSNLIRIRGHHILNLAVYLEDPNITMGNGFLHTWRIKNLFKKIKNSDDQPIQIVNSLDDICKYCKYNKKRFQCDIVTSITYDKAFIVMAGLRAEELYKPKDLFNKLELCEDLQKVVKSALNHNFSSFYIAKILWKYGYRSSFD